MMTKEDFIALAKKRYQALQKLDPNTITFYDYEKALLDLTRELTKDAYEKKIGDASKAQRKKKDDD